MGTTYNIKIVTDKNFDTKEIKTSVDSILIVFNQQMSTWDPKSEISTFNRWTSLDSFKVSKYFYDVVREALVISEQSQGMFDITVFDLLSLWGFGPNPKSGIPEKNIDASWFFFAIEKVSNDFFKLRSPSFKDRFFDSDTIFVKNFCSSCFFG